MRFTRRLAAVVILGASPALAQDLPTVQNPVEPLLHGQLVYHGNYCGPGNKGVHPAPVDALDAACMRHDACTKDFELPACSCNQALHKEAMLVAEDPRAPTEEREAASFTAEGAQQLPCKP